VEERIRKEEKGWGWGGGHWFGSVRF
jgi:hypothetical protein